ncbi:MAG: selenocysteine-specific elongation factor [Alphaproteobacteria bacterium]|jgi:selenocysteine-specific elongation factor
MIIATAGHIDHGKTSLVKALTGVDADRLPEEQKRGLTIDLGFAYEPVEDDLVLGFVDVPGHEKFVRNMLAGVGAIDFALLIVAADDGPMPQTREHLAILNLLGVSVGAVALTKIDRVDDVRRMEAMDEIAQLLEGTSLASAPVLPVSGITGEGVPELKAHLVAAAHIVQRRSEAGNFRLAIDRVFTITGSGLVVTGTVYAGQAKIGDRLMLTPQGVEVRVRAIHAQNKDAKTGFAGERCALNIAGAELTKDMVSRGDWIVGEVAHAPTDRFDARIRVLASEDRPFRHWTPVHLHLGAVDVGARVATLEDRAIPVGETGLAQIVLDRPIGALHGDRFILRDQSARRTMGGGVVIDSFSPVRGRARPERLAIVRGLEKEGAVSALESVLTESPAGVDLNRFAAGRNLTPEEADSVWRDATMVKVGRQQRPIGMSSAHWTAVGDMLVSALRDWHAKWPDRPGPEEERLRRLLGRRTSEETFNAAIVGLLRDRKIVRDGAQLALPNHRPAFSAEDSALWSEVEELLQSAGTRPPRLLEVADAVEMDVRPLGQFLQRAVRIGLIAKVADNRYFLPSTLLTLGKMAEDLAAKSEDAQFTAGEYNKFSGLGRNLAIQLLEYFDRSGLTRRAENRRSIVKPANDVYGDAFTNK